ncbi:MAG TPA: Wzz/FepE/Etk N-terminal domain-containing protein [Burkholderiales bacterium]
MEGMTHLSDYLAILRRRRGQIVRVALAVLAVAVALALLLPPVYRSTATLLIEQEVSPELVPSTVTGYIVQRVKVIEARILTAEKLAGIARKLDLYAEERDRGDEYVAGRMRGNIDIQAVSANVTDPSSGRSGMATIAFEVSYDAPEPAVAQAVAQELAESFIAENQALRTAKAKGASGFLHDEEERLRRQIADLEARLAAYKSRNQGRLPELMTLNLQMLERAQREADEAERQIYALEERKLELQSQLALVEPHTGDSPGGKLRQLQTEYLAAAARYSPQHPDVVRLRRELEAMKREAGVVDERGALESAYREARAKLQAARERYAPGHPDVVKLESTVANLQQRLARADARPAGFEMKPDNPAYVTLQTQLGAVELNLQEAKERRDRAKRRMAEYEERLVQTPQAEQEGLALQREYDAAMKKYREIKQSLMSANLAVELEKDQKGERYSILQPAKLPSEPERPNRKAFILLGLVLGLGSGVGYASLAEYMDRTVRGSRAVVHALGAPPLAAIPFIPNGIDPPGRVT